MTTKDLSHHGVIKAPVVLGGSLAILAARYRKVGIA